MNINSLSKSVYLSSGFSVLKREKELKVGISHTQQHQLIDSEIADQATLNKYVYFSESLKSPPKPKDAEF